MGELDILARIYDMVMYCLDYEFILHGAWGTYYFTLQDALIYDIFIVGGGYVIGSLLAKD